MSTRDESDPEYAGSLTHSFGTALPKITEPTSHSFVSDRDKLRALSPEASEFYRTLREKGLLYDDGGARIGSWAAKPAEPVEVAPRAPAVLIEDLMPRTLLHSELEQISRNIAHAMGLLAGAWLAECPTPHAALRRAGLLNEYSRNNGGRAVAESEKRISLQLNTRMHSDLLAGFGHRSMRSLAEHEEGIARLQRDATSKHAHGSSVDFAVIDDPLPEYTKAALFRAKYSDEE